jgi:hypothetical protein
MIRLNHTRFLMPSFVPKRRFTPSKMKFSQSKLLRLQDCFTFVASKLKTTEKSFIHL